MSGDGGKLGPTAWGRYRGGRQRRPVGLVKQDSTSASHLVLADWYFVAGAATQNITGALYDDSDWFGSGVVALVPQDQSGGGSLRGIRRARKKSRLKLAALTQEAEKVKTKVRFVYLPDALDKPEAPEAESIELERKPEPEPQPAQPVASDVPSSPLDLQAFLATLAAQIDDETLNLERLKTLEFATARAARLERQIAAEQARNDDEDAATLMLLLAA